MYIVGVRPTDIFIIHSISLFIDIDEVIATKMTQITDDNGRRLWRCIDCYRESQNKKDIARHIEATHIAHPGFECEFCSVLCKTRDSLRHHIKAYHKS